MNTSIFLLKGIIRIVLRGRAALRPKDAIALPKEFDKIPEFLNFKKM